jgi:NADH-quinone oxidoreductase subunit J
MKLYLILLSILLLSAVWTVMTTRLLRAVLGLALTSAVLSVIMFALGSPMAAVFELSVCAGLIPVIFFTTISFTQRLSETGAAEKRKTRFPRFCALLLIIVVLGAVLIKANLNYDLPAPAAKPAEDVRSVLWNVRHIDILGQIIMILIGSFGVTVLFKEAKK